MGDFNFQKEMLLYCRNGVDVLRRACMKFRDMLLEITGHRSEELYSETLRYPLRYLTIAAVCMNVFRSKFLKEEHLLLLRTECENTKKEGGQLVWIEAVKEANKSYVNNTPLSDVVESRFIRSP